MREKLNDGKTEKGRRMNKGQQKVELKEKKKRKEGEREIKRKMGNKEKKEKKIN